MENNNELTSREFWLNYWKQKMDRDEIAGIENTYLFSDVLIENARKSTDNSVMEIGGFPGLFPLFLKKKAGVNPAIFDYIVHPDFLRVFLERNGFREGDLELIEGDIRSYVPEKQFGMVFSIGLIEHFDDTAYIIGKHLPFCKPGGRLMILLPNFTGVNGWLNKTFDLPNYRAHNIGSMEPELLKRIAGDLGLKNINVYYHGKFSIWLENYKEQNFFVKLFFKSVWLWGKVFTRIFPFESRLLSPYIILEADKPGNAS